MILDGDNVRHGLNGNLGFSDEDRTENIRRVGEVSKLFFDAGIITLCTFISPFIKDRDRVRSLFEAGQFIEIFVKCNLDTCKDRDPKGLYKKALAGEIKQFTGISSPYEEPANPELTVESDSKTVEEVVADIVSFLKEKGIVNK